MSRARTKESAGEKKKRRRGGERERQGRGVERLEKNNITVTRKNAGQGREAGG